MVRPKKPTDKPVGRLPGPLPKIDASFEELLKAAVALVKKD